MSTLALISIAFLLKSQNINITNVNIKIYDISDVNIDFRDARPDKNDTIIKMCIPAAFTSTRMGFIDGIYIVNGVPFLQDTMHRKYKGDIWGGLSISDGRLGIHSTNEGTLSNEIAQSVVAENGDFFEQFLLVKEGVAKKFNNERLNNPHIRRAIGMTNTGKWYIIESKDRIGLNRFAKMLVTFDLRDAVYLDMGSYGEGWYRDLSGEIYILTPGTNTHNQTNWLIFY